MTEVIARTTVIETFEVIAERSAPKLDLRIKAAPAIRQIYWCDFPEDSQVPEMGKERPVVIVSFKNTLHGHSLVLPTSTDPQEGLSAKWAHKLSFKVDGHRESWVVCNHLYTVSNVRLTPAKVIPRVAVAEFNQILTIMHRWLPVVGGG